MIDSGSRSRGQIALGALALRAGLEVGMVEGPPYKLGAPPRAEFDKLLRQENNGLIDEVDVTKHEFLSYLVHERGLLLHGTASSDLDQVRRWSRSTTTPAPSKRSLRRRTDLPVFFATLDRGRAGSLWNGCYQIRRGSVIHRYYFFFTEADPRDETIWRDGAVYVLPREPFRRTWIPNEWVSAQPVSAMGKLSVSPSDFPFKNRVKRFDQTLSLMGNLRRFSE